jgi:hypothetical protein
MFLKASGTNPSFDCLIDFYNSTINNAAFKKSFIKQLIFNLLNNFKMKTRETIMLLACILSLTACKKESYSDQYLKDAALKQGTMVSTEAYCPKIDPSDFVKGINNPYLTYCRELHFIMCIK